MGLKGEESPSVGLSLELGPKIPSSSHAKTGFTFFQLQELEHQALIYKYFQAGIPVPPYLVIPIWKSLVHSCSRFGIHPSVLGVCFDYRNTMEAEPGRCRRTDGKKWRCSKDVVPDQKYCERHMHRGRNRSRKPVETNHGNSSNASLSFPMPLQFMTPATTSTTTPTGNNNATNYVSHQPMDFSPQIVLQTKPEHNPVYDNCS